jgi:hypothetical protein
MVLQALGKMVLQTPVVGAVLTQQPVEIRPAQVVQVAPV